MTEQAARPVPSGDGGTAAGRGVRRLLAAAAGLLAAAVALGVAELAAALVGPASSPVLAVGDAAITLTPEPVKAFGAGDRKGAGLDRAASSSPAGWPSAWPPSPVVADVSCTSASTSPVSAATSSCRARPPRRPPCRPVPTSPVVSRG